MHTEGVSTPLQRLLKLHAELTALQRQAEQLAQAACQALQDLIRSVHPATGAPTSNT